MVPRASTAAQVSLQNPQDLPSVLNAEWACFLWQWGPRLAQTVWHACTGRFKPWQGRQAALCARLVLSQLQWGRLLHSPVSSVVLGPIRVGLERQGAPYAGLDITRR